MPASRSTSWRAASVLDVRARASRPPTGCWWRSRAPAILAAHRAHDPAAWPGLRSDGVGAAPPPRDGAGGRGRRAAGRECVGLPGRAGPRRSFGSPSQWPRSSAIAACSGGRRRATSSRGSRSLTLVPLGGSRAGVRRRNGSRPSPGPSPTAMPLPPRMPWSASTGPCARLALPTSPPRWCVPRDPTWRRATTASSSRRTCAMRWKPPRSMPSRRSTATTRSSPVSRSRRFVPRSERRCDGSSPSAGTMRDDVDEVAIGAVSTPSSRDAGSPGTAIASAIPPERRARRPALAAAMDRLVALLDVPAPPDLSDACSRRRLSAGGDPRPGGGRPDRPG